MRKFKLFQSYDSEEQWLSEQAAAGWTLAKKGLLYTFRKQSPQKLVYNVDYRTFKSKADYQSYLSLFADAGWTHAAGSLRSGEQYFTASPRPGKELSIYSDKESSHSRYAKKAWHSLLKVIFPVAFMTISRIYDLFDFKMIVQPSRAFLTPGIWERTGEAFWQAFFFELPFALVFRILPCILVIGYVLLFAFYTGWALYCARHDREIIKG